MKKLCLCTLMCAIVLMTPLSVGAAEVLPTQEKEILQSEVVENENVEKSSTIVQYNFEPTQPIAVYQVNEDDYNSSGIMTMAMNDSVYVGSYNTTAITLWEGIIANNVGRDYVAYRASQYEYVIFVGEHFQNNGSVFTGTGTYYKLNTYAQSYEYIVGEDAFTVDAGNYYIYTNVSENYPSLGIEKELIYAEHQNVILISLLVFLALRWIFVGK